MPEAVNAERQFKYDVAISLLSRDAALGEALAEKLAPLKSFVFTKEQREIVGRNGVEAFAEVFRRDARLTVILFRQGYGHTEYTDLEVRGIQDRSMETRWRTPIVINLDGSSPPAWFPHRNIWLDLQRYPIAEAVGAIRLRAEELGAAQRPESPAELLGRLAAQNAAIEHRTAHAQSESGFAELERQVVEMTGQLKRLFEEGQSKLAAAGPQIIPLQPGIALVSRFGSVVVSWYHPYTRSLTEAVLSVTFYDGYVSVGGRVAAREPRRLSECVYTPVYDVGEIWRWYTKGSTRPAASSELVDQILTQLFGIIFERHRR